MSEKQYSVKMNIGDKCYFFGKEDIILEESTSYLKKRNHYRYKTEKSGGNWFACYDHYDNRTILCRSLH